MPRLQTSPVLLQDLINNASDINSFNDGAKSQQIQPRATALATIAVQVIDDVLTPVISSGVANLNVLNALVNTAVNFLDLGVEVGDSVLNTAANTLAVVTEIITTTNPNDTLVLGTSDIFPLGNESYAVRGSTFWVQKQATGEWKQSKTKLGTNKLATYNLPIGGTVQVHQIVYPWNIADLANYPSR